MGYRFVFDVTAVGYQWWIPSMIFVFAGLFVVIGWGIRTIGEPDFRTKGLFFQIIGAVGLGFAILFFVGMYAQYHFAEKALMTHNCSVAEGVVTDFIPMPPGGHSIESLRIGVRHFEYGTGWGSTTFNSEWNKGFIHNGVQARVTYHGADILKVEIKSP
jgi:hypothetical protein